MIVRAGPDVVGPGVVQFSGLRTGVGNIGPGPVRRRHTLGKVVVNPRARNGHDTGVSRVHVERQGGVSQHGVGARRVVHPDTTFKRVGRECGIEVIDGDTARKRRHLVGEKIPGGERGGRIGSLLWLQPREKLSACIEGRWVAIQRRAGDDRSCERQPEQRDGSAHPSILFRGHSSRDVGRDKASQRELKNSNARPMTVSTSLSSMLKKIGSRTRQEESCSVRGRLRPSWNPRPMGERCKAT